MQQPVNRAPYSYHGEYSPIFTMVNCMSLAKPLYIYKDKDKDRGKRPKDGRAYAPRGWTFRSGKKAINKGLH